MNKDFSYYLTTFFSSYLVEHSGFSINTIKSYRDTFVILINYFKNELKIKADKISLENFSKNFIEVFLLFLEKERKNSISTRNQRLAAIHSFFKYIGDDNFKYFDLFNEILKVKFKKVPMKTIKYLTEDNVREYLKKPNTKFKSDLRDLAVIILLYDSGMRVQEICDLTLEHLKLGGKPVIIVNGKGNKTRIIPISDKTKDVLCKYLKDYNVTEINDYIFTNENGGKLSRWGITYIINKYIDEKISPHQLRHSKAMHLLEENVNLIYIRDFLGHNSITTTEIYAKANPEIKRKYIQEASNRLLPNQKKFTKDKKLELDEWLRENI